MSSTRTSRTTRFLAAAAFGAAGLSALGATAASATAAFSTVAGNPSCADVAIAGETWTEHKLDFDPSAGPYSPGGFKVTITKAADGSLGWTSEKDVAAVIMKGGNNANVYAYPGASDLADSGLRTPVNPNGNGDEVKYYGISHVTFCAGPPVTPPTTETPSTPGETPKPAVTPTPEPEVQAAAAPAPAAPAPAAAVPEVPTQVLGVSLEAPAPAAAAPAQLAVTGVSSTMLATLAIALILFGGLALALGGRATTED